MNPFFAKVVIHELPLSMARASTFVLLALVCSPGSLPRFEKGAQVRRAAARGRCSCVLLGTPFYSRLPLSLLLKMLFTA